MAIEKAIHIHITGLVQGVGFRPFVFRMAHEHDIKGWVENGNDGVHIHAEGEVTGLERFVACLRDQAPVASRIHHVISLDADTQGFNAFAIRSSSDRTEEITDVSPDISVCPECLHDLKAQPHRIGYPLINCTNCGPRFTIIRELPYDRDKTTMSDFPMCDTCRAEYSDPLDRRFHAQPVACNHCGPRYLLLYGKESTTGFQYLLAQAAELIGQGKIVAIKGTGGYHLACDATDETAVGNLRKRKNREGKPFAVMFRSLEAAGDYVRIDSSAAGTLGSWQRPIVILENRTGGKTLAFGVSNGFNTTGIMLPYMPFHYLLFEKLATPAIVLTSGNISDEPVIIDDRVAMENLGGIADAFISYNRDIHNRCDDSVAMACSGKTRIIRRSRGYAPAPVNLHLDVDGIFAAGAELVNCFCIGKGRQAIMSQHIGDLKNLETLEFYRESAQRYRKMFRFSPKYVVCDLHPDYLSTRFAEEMARNGASPLPLTGVQHHHAHIASCMAEHGLDEAVIGISLDGVGYGSDGNTWGFEIMRCDLADFARLSHLAYIPQPGGDLATLQPWRMALAYLYQYADRKPSQLDLPFIRRLDPDKAALIIQMMERKINVPLTSSAGRLFDAVSALLGLCHESAFHAEAPMRLENVLNPQVKGSYRFTTGEVIDPAPVIRDIVEDLQKGTDAGIISARFHRAVARAITDAALMARERTGLDKVVLSGGTFQNRFLLALCEDMLGNARFRVFMPEQFPANDGGIALGQLIIAAKRHQLGLLSVH